MPRIHTIPPGEATGPLKEHYEAGVRRAGRVAGILRLQSLRPDVLDLFVKLYLALMYAPSELTRAQREMIATVVSRENHCHY